MRTITIEKKIAKFGELNEEQKKKVLDKLRYINVDYEWWDFIKEDFHTILEVLGFYQVKSEFTGFYSQGDGASFSGIFQIPLDENEMQDRVSKLKNYAPNYLLEHEIKNFLTLNFKDWNDYNTIEIYKSGRYSHEMTMQCDHDDLLEFSRELALTYYNNLEKQYDYLMSDEAIIETIEANEYEFDLDTCEIY